MTAGVLTDIFSEGLRRNPGGVAVREPGAMITYRELDELANRFAHALAGRGVKAGDRVGIWMPKSIRTVAAMQAVLRLGAAYVPVDPLSPPARARQILEDSAVSACVTAAELAGAEALPATPLPPAPASSDSLAYILYTSGSTGRPKGVCISHRNALAFIEWAVAELEPGLCDRFSSHAPFHFDLSVLDLYAAFASGACVSLIPEGISFVPERLVEFARRERITIWYSVPSALSMMMETGGLLDPEPISLRTIVFAGEPFPIVPLRRLRAHFEGVRMLNLYGPTETNVCTYHEVFGIPEDQVCVPIGRACSGDRVWAIKDDGTEASIGESGELLVDGPTVMMGYWGRAPHEGPYRTGDIVERLDSSNYAYHGRRDGMVKVRGHRVELGEVEAAVSAHPSVREAAAVAVGSGTDTRLVAAVSFRDEPAAASLLDLKKECAARLPRYMIVHDLHELPALPRTPNGKVDRRALQTICEEQPC